MVTIQTGEMKRVLIPFADEARSKLALPNLSTAAVAHYVALQKVLSTMLIFLNDAEKRGEVNMKDLAESISTEIVNISDIPLYQRSSHWFDVVKSELEGLKPGQAKKIDPKKIAYQHLQSTVARMKRRKLIEENVRVIKAKDTFYLAMQGATSK